MSSPLSTFTPELPDVIRTIVDQMMMNLNVCLPAKIVSYDPDTQYADVQIQILKRFSDLSTFPYPVIPHVPVKHPRAAGGAAFIHMPLQVGDDVTLVFSQRSLDNWKTSNPTISGSSGGVDTQDIRKHNINDAYALVGGSAMPDAFEVSDPTAIEIVNGSAKISIFPDGKFKFGNASADLIALMQMLAQTLSEDTTNTILGPQPLNDFETYAQIATKLQSLQE